MTDPDSTEAFKMPTDYKEWIQDVERIHEAITALTYANYALVAEHRRRFVGREELISPDDVPAYEAVVTILNALDGLQAVFVDWGVPIAPVERERVLGREMCRYFPGGHR